MGLFDIKKRSSFDDSVDPKELSREIVERSQLVEQLKNDIAISKQKNEQLEEDYLAKIKELEDKQSFFNEQIAQQKDSFNARINKLEEKRENFTADYENKVAQLNEKVEALKASQAELLERKDELKRKDFLNKKRAIESKIDALSTNLKNYKDAYNQNIDDTTQRYNALIAKKDEELLALNTKKKKFIENANAEIDRLEKQKKEIEDYNNSQLRALADEQESIASITKAKQAKEIKDKQRELDNVNAELKSLETFKRNLNNDLETTKVAHDREYNNLIAKFESEKEKQAKENERLKTELSEKQRRYEEESLRQAQDYETQVKQLDELIGALKNRGSDADAKLKEKLEASDAEFARKFKNYLEKLEDDYARQAKQRQDEIDNLNYQLNKEEEKCTNEKHFLERQYENANISFKNSIEEKTVQISNAQAVLNELENEHNALVKSSVSRIAELRKENEVNLKNKAGEYEKALEELKKEYANKKLQIDERVITLRNSITNIKEEINDKQQEFDEFKKTKEAEKSELIAEQDAFLSKNKRERQDVEQKIADLKALMEKANREYNNNVEAINSRRSLMQTESDSAVAEITNKYKNKTQAIEDEYNLKVDRATREHEDKLESLNREYSRSVNDLKQAVSDKQKELGNYTEEVNNKIESLRQDTDAKVSNLKQQNEDLNLQINAIKQKMQDENHAFDNDVRALQDEYVARLNELSINQNDAIQKVLDSYENEPNQQLSSVKDEYDEVQRHYSETLATITENKKKLIEGENELKNQINSQKSELNAELASKTSDFEKITNEYNLAQSQQTREIARLQVELDSLKNKCELQITSLTDLNDKKFESYQGELRAKYESLVRTLDDKQERNERQFEKELANTKEDTEAKLAQLNSAIAEIEAKRSSYEKLYSSMYESALKDVESTKAVLQSLNDKRLDENQKHIATLDTIKNANAEAITSKQEEYDKLLQQASSEYSLRHQQIDDAIEDTKKNTAAIEESIAKINKEYNQYLADANTRKQAIIDAHSDYIANTSKSISTVSNRINEIKNLLNDTQRNYNSEVLKLNAKRTNMQEEYERNLAEIDSLYKTKVNEITAQFDQKTIDTKYAHEEALKNLKNDFNERIKEIERTYEDKKEEYRLLKKNYKKDINDIEEDTKGKVTAFKNQENEMKASVENIKVVMEAEKRKYEEDIERLNIEKETRLAQIDKLQQDAINRLILENETNPNAVLNEVKAKFDESQKNYNDRLLEIAQNKQLVDTKEAELNKHNVEQKDAADKELAAKNDEYNSLKSESERTFATLDIQLNEKRNELATFTNEINTLTQRYRDGKEQEYVAVSKDLEEKLSSLLDKNSINEQTTSSGYNNHLSNMSIETNAKIASIDRKIADINAIKNSKQEECDRLLFDKTNEYNQSISDLKQELEQLTSDKITNAEYYKKTIEKTEKDNANIIEKKRAESAAAIADAKESLALESENIKAHTDTLRKQIAKNNKSLEAATKEYEEYAAASQARNEAVLNEQGEYLGYIDQQKAKVEEKIDGLKAIIASKQSRFDEQAAVIESQRAALQSEYDNKVVGIDREYQDKLRALNEKNALNANDAREKHEAVLRALQASFEERCERVKNDFEAKKEEYKNIKNNYRSDIEKYKQNIKDRINELKNQQEEFARNVADTKEQIKADNDEFNEETKRVQAEFNTQVKLINEEKRNKIRELNHTYIEIPNDELNMINSTLSDAKNDYQNAVENFNNKKKELDAYEKSVIDKFERLRGEANESYANKNAQYDETYEKLQNIEYKFDEKLNKSKQDLETLRNNIDASIEKIRADKAKELDDYSARYYEDYEKQQARYKEIQDSTVLKNDKEIAALTDHLNTKKEAINTLINEINERKKKAEDERTIEYNVAVEETNRMQAELESINSERSLKKTSYENEIASKREANRASIDSLKAKLEEFLVKKKQEFVEEGDRKQLEIKNTQEEISSLKVEKDAVNKKLEAYEKEKNASVDTINKELESFLKSIEGKLNDLAQKSIALDEAHKKRIIDVKTQIAQTVSEYDDLMKLKPKLISSAYDEKVDFMSVTKKFKEMVDELESSHVQILEGLETKRINAIEGIKKEIEDIDTTKPEKLKEFEDQITRLTEAYDAMLADEKAKQTTLSNEIMIANREREKLEDSTNSTRMQMATDYEAIMTEINASYNKRYAEANSQYEKLASTLRKEFAGLASERDSLKADLSRLNDGFMKVDDDIRREMMQLKNSYNTQLLSVQAEYEAKVKSNREKLKSLDAMSNDSNLLF